MNSITGLSPHQLRQAADIKEQIDALQDQLNALLGQEAPIAPWAVAAPTRRRKMSAAGRAAIAVAARARWAAYHAARGKPVKKARRRLSAQGLANIRAGVLKRMAAQRKGLVAKPAKKVKKHFSAAARAALAAAIKARWAKAKAAGKSRL